MAGAGGQTESISDETRDDQDQLAQWQFDAGGNVLARAARGELGPHLQERMRQSRCSVDPIRRLLMYNSERPQNCVHDITRQMGDGPVNPEAKPVTDPAAMARQIKEFARFMGAGLVGITAVDQRFVFRGRQVPHRTAVVIAREMDRQKVRLAPSWISDAATGKAYAEVAVIAALVAGYIRELGYPALAHHRTREDVLHVPLAVAAGLGEMGRNGFLITRPYGPRVRLATVTTDLPLAHDAPADLGVDAFCRDCAKCADVCPPKAIARGEKTTVRGVTKWAIDPLRCARFWMARPEQWESCCMCIMSCPWNKPDTWYHRWATALAARSRPGRKVLMWLDDLLYGRKPSYSGRWLEYEKHPGLGR